MSDTLPGLFLGQSDAAQPENLLFNRANRHGVVAGATGTGKTVTLQILAQGFSDAGVPVFCADVKGDLSGISQVGAPNDKLIACGRNGSDPDAARLWSSSGTCMARRGIRSAPRSPKSVRC